MFQSDYKRDIEAVGPSPAQLARLMTAMETKEEAPVKRKVLQTVLVVAALCVALAATALAVSPTLREALVAALGGFEPFSQEVENVFVEDQGIRVSVIKTIADESGGTAYLEIQDLTGDRLTEDTWLRKGGVSVVAYDPEKRTLLAKCTWTKEFMDVNEDGTYSFTLPITEIWGGEEFEGIALPQVLVSPDNVLETQLAPEETSCGTGDDRVVLVPEQTSLTLEGTDKFTLSSMGFDEQGRLHVQLRIADEYIDQISEPSYFLDMVALHNYLEETCDIDFYSNGQTHSLEDGRYLDFVYLPYVPDYRQGTTIGCLPKEYLQDAPVMLQGWIGTRERVEGDWTLTFPLELQPARTVSVGQEVNTKYVESVDLSVMSATLRLNDGTSQVQGSICFHPLTIYKADGTSVTIQRGRNIYWGHQGDDGGAYYLDAWNYPEPIDPAEVVGISIGSWYYAIPK